MESCGGKDEPCNAHDAIKSYLPNHEKKEFHEIGESVPQAGVAGGQSPLARSGQVGEEGARASSNGRIASVCVR